MSPKWQLQDRSGLQGQSSKQALEPSKDWRPAGHNSQAVCPSEDAKRPAGQAEQAAAVPKEKYPLGQGLKTRTTSVY